MEINKSTKIAVKKNAMPTILTGFVMDLNGLVGQMYIDSTNGKITIPEANVMLKVLQKLVANMDDYQKDKCYIPIMNMIQELIALDYKRSTKSSVSNFRKNVNLAMFQFM
ncbi:unnamed protein product [marine sediment metagenome]|uniref:Uncharacterized protein n=1 Tax=marine sediment metagenome TaxID=412755 RepID=X1FVZ2_9ZZZZ